MKGRKPTKSAELKILTGSKHAGDGSAPAVKRCIPSCPGHLDDEARKEWKRLAQELEAAGVLTALDRAALAAYCAAYSRWVKSETIVAARGAVLGRGRGLYQNPWAAAANKALEQMAKFGQLLGLDPTSRTRLHATAPVVATQASVSDFSRKRG